MALRLRINNKNSDRCSYISEWKISTPDGQITRGVPLGASVSMTKSEAQRRHERIQAIVTTQRLGLELSSEQLTFLSKLPDKSYNKLATYGVVCERIAIRSKGSFSLGNVRKEFQAGRDVKESTQDNENRAFDLLEAYLKVDKDVRNITLLDAERFSKWLPKQRLIGTGKLLASTVSGHLRKINGLFNYMVKAKLIVENPFDDINTPMNRDKSKDYYVTIHEADDYIESVDHPQWKAIIAIARYCGVRGPSDLLYMQRKHVDFDKQQVTFPSVKNGNRVCPLFPQVAEHFRYLCDRENTPSRYLFKDAEQGDHGKKGNWEAVRASGKLKLLNLRETPNSAYQRVTGNNPIPRFFKNCRATRVTELIKIEGFSQHSVCEWIGHTEQISNQHYLMMMEEDHVKAVSSNTTPITTPKSDPTSETQTIPDSVTKQAFASLSDNQLDKLTLVLQGLAGVIETQPESAHLLLTAISDEAKKPQSSSNRGRTCTPEGTGS